MTTAQAAVRATLDGAIIDSSVLMCILLGEPAAPLFITALQKTDRLYISAATRSEVWLAAFNAKGTAGARQVEALLVALQVETVDFTQDSLPHFVEGAERHHHKVDAKARLNLGDLFTYALASETARVRHQMTQVVDLYRASFKLATTKGSTGRLGSVF